MEFISWICKLNIYFISCEVPWKSLNSIFTNKYTWEVKLYWNIDSNFLFIYFLLVLSNQHFYVLLLLVFCSSGLLFLTICCTWGASSSFFIFTSFSACSSSYCLNATCASFASNLLIHAQLQHLRLQLRLFVSRVILHKTDDTRFLILIIIHHNHESF